MNRHAEQIRNCAEGHEVALVDGLATFQACATRGGELTDLMSQGNDPNRNGHDSVIEKRLEWFAE